MPLAASRNHFESVSVPVKHVSFEDLFAAELFDLSDDGFAAADVEAQDSARAIMRCLTKRQRQVAQRLLKGKTHKEIAEDLGCSTQRIHDLVPIMRRRLIRKGWGPRHVAR